MDKLKKEIEKILMDNMDMADHIFLDDAVDNLAEYFKNLKTEDEMRSYVSDKNGDPDSAYEYLNGLEVNGRYRMVDIETFLNR